MELEIGMKAEVSSLVEKMDTASEVGSGSLLVFATPCMVAMMEGAACEAIAPALPEGKTSVGTGLQIEHLAATPVGMEVRATAELIQVDGRMLTFQVAAFDEKGEIGRGTHRRAVVDAQRFLEKTYDKL